MCQFAILGIERLVANLTGKGLVQLSQIYLKSYALCVHFDTFFRTIIAFLSKALFSEKAMFSCWVLSFFFCFCIAKNVRWPLWLQISPIYSDKRIYFTDKLTPDKFRAETKKNSQETHLLVWSWLPSIGHVMALLKFLDLPNLLLNTFK